MGACQLGGISAIETAPTVGAKEKAWVVGAGTTIPPELSIREEHPGNGHWFWEPAYDMPFLDYEQALISANGLFA